MVRHIRERDPEDRIGKTINMWRKMNRDLSYVFFDDVGQGPTLDRKRKIVMSDLVRHRTAKELLYTALTELSGGRRGVMLGRQNHRRALLRCRGLVDETLRMEGAHLKTPEMYPT
ncbi:UNVERIFIED_CONTAM: hypothetical protein FKN15_011960 [Acipenser sinensis]